MIYFIIGLLLFMVVIILYSACAISSKCHDLKEDKEESELVYYKNMKK